MKHDPNHPYSRMNPNRNLNTFSWKSMKPTAPDRNAFTVIAYENDTFRQSSDYWPDPCLHFGTVDSSFRTWYFCAIVSAIH